MPTHQINPTASASRFALCWSLFRQGFRYANVASHHALGMLLKLGILAYFLFCVILLTLRYGVLPNIDRYKGDVEQIATHAIGRPVSIRTIYASWHGLRPHLFLGGVVIHDRNGREALSLPGVAATFSWWSVLAADVRLHTLEISRPDLDIERDDKGNLFIGGIFIDLRKSGDGKGADWILSQREIVIRDGRIRWNDGERGTPELALEGVNFMMLNSWHHHKFALNATPPVEFAAPFDIRADFDHPAFARKVSDIKQWKGELYADLQDTDLAIWKTYVDYPVDVRQGTGAVRAWLNFDHAKIADFTADLTLSNVSAQLRKDLQPMNLTRVSGRVSVREEFRPDAVEGTPTFGTQGHAVSLAGFSLQTDDGMVLPPTTISETFVAAGKDHPERTEVRIQSLDLQTLANFVERLPLAPAQLKMLFDFAPRGQLRDFSAQWQGTYPDVVSYNVKGEFIGLSMKAQAPRPGRTKTARAPAQAAVPAIPGFENLTGRVDANDKGGNINLMSEQVKFNLPNYFDNPMMSFDQLKMQANWAFEDKDQLLLEVRKMDFVQQGLAGSLSGRHLIPMTAQHGKSLGVIDMTGHIARLDLDQVSRFLPSATPAAMRAWLTGSLVGGMARDLVIKLKGDLAGFPFHADGAGRQRGEFSVTGKIDNGKLNYAPGRFAQNGASPLWPLLEEVNGVIAFDRTRMEIHADSARTHNVALSNVNAVVPDLLSPNVTLAIDGSAAGPLQEFVRYTVDSPVDEWIAHFTEETRAGGNARLALKLQMPLNHLIDSKVQGTLQFAGNDVALQDVMPPLLGTDGKLEFNERGLTLNAVKATFLGGPVVVSGGTQRDGNIVIRAGGSLSSAGVRKTFAAPAMQRLADRITGGTRYNATISVRKKRTEIVVESNLQGIALDFPMPLRKGLNEAMPLRLELAALPGEDAAGMHDELKLSLGSAISARYLRQKLPEKNAAWRVVRGGIGINVPAPVPDSGLIANVNMKSLSIDAWNQVVSTIVGTGDKQKGSAPSDALNIAQYIEPEVLAARAGELFVAGKRLDNVVVGASHQKGIWQANIDSEQASGYVTWSEAPSGQAQGKATARLSSLVIPKSAASDVTDLLEGKNTAMQIPALDIVAENFELFGKKLGRLELVANNMGAAANREWRINRLLILNPDAEFKATGKWITKDGGSISNLSYALDIGNAGKLLDRFGFSNVMRGGKGKMDGELNWKGLPFSLDIPTLSGQFKLDLAAGQFLKVEPGAAKLLGVLSMQSLPRRLVLDFRDVFSEGFAFDGIAGSAQIAQGIARTDNLKMRGVNATVLLDGSADIAKESQNLHVVVIPEINAGAASVVYGLAVNPIIGVGTFLAQLFLRDPLARAFTFEYKVTGPWQDPVVTKLEHKNSQSGKQRNVDDETEKAG